MADQPPPKGPDPWPLLDELLERGDPAFVDELRRVADADALGAFAPRWYADRRPAARRLLLDYLDRPLNAFRHEALVKRLFKLAEAAADDEVVGRFLVLFDRSVRRIRRTVRRWDRVARQIVQGQVATTPSQNVMPRPKPEDLAQWNNERQRERLEPMRLFSVPTRCYLRRRAWRYFRRLGRTDAGRYLPAVLAILPRYRDEDVGDGLALLDNWGLVHILFHFSPALVSNPTGWTLAAGHSLAEVKADPIYPKLWQADPAPLLGLLDVAPSRTVRQWAIQMLRRDHPKALKALPLETLVGWLGHRSSEMVALAVDLLKTGPGLAGVPVGRLLGLLRSASPETLEMLCDLLAGSIRAEQVSAADAATLARQKPLTLARLGFDLLRQKTVQTEADADALLGLAEAEAESLRGELVRWSCGALGASSRFRPAWVLEYLDSRHAEVRAAGWAWLQAEPRARDDVETWRRLLESPYPEVRATVVEHLEPLVDGAAVEVERDVLDPWLVRVLWASVLLNVARGNRTKPVVVRQLMRRLERRPAEAEQLLPILGAALRSLRGPEFRTGLLAVVRWANRAPEQVPLLQRLLPELQLTPAGVG